jgi:hypothetical protein
MQAIGVEQRSPQGRTKRQGTYLSEFGRGFQILLQAAEGRIVVLEVCARGLAAAAPQIAGHGMGNVVVGRSVGAPTCRDARVCGNGGARERIASFVGKAQDEASNEEGEARSPYW